MFRLFFKHALFLFILGLAFVGCASKAPLHQERGIATLATALEGLSSTHSRGEALRLSQDLFSYTEHLRKKFQLTSPPSYHNFLVNVGLKEKGLCYHWSDALYVYLHTKAYQHFEFHLLGANIGAYWREHNVLVVVAKGEAWEEGIIVDPWRNSGKVYFSKVKNDKKYLWKHRAQRGCKRHSKVRQ